MQNTTQYTEIIIEIADFAPPLFESNDNVNNEYYIAHIEKVNPTSDDASQEQNKTKYIYVNSKSLLSTIDLNEYPNLHTLTINNKCYKEDMFKTMLNPKLTQYDIKLPSTVQHLKLKKLLYPQISFEHGSTLKTIELNDIEANNVEPLELPNTVESIEVVHTDIDIKCGFKNLRHIKFIRNEHYILSHQWMHKAFALARDYVYTNVYRIKNIAYANSLMLDDLYDKTIKNDNIENLWLRNAGKECLEKIKHFKNLKTLIVTMHGADQVINDKYDKENRVDTHVHKLSGDELNPSVIDDTKTNTNIVEISGDKLKNITIIARPDDRYKLDIKCKNCETLHLRNCDIVNVNRRNIEDVTLFHTKVKSLQFPNVERMVLGNVNVRNNKEIMVLQKLKQFICLTKSNIKDINIVMPSIELLQIHNDSVPFITCKSDELNINVHDYDVLYNKLRITDDCKTINIVGNETLNKRNIMKYKLAQNIYLRIQNYNLGNAFKDFNELVNLKLDVVKGIGSLVSVNYFKDCKKLNVLEIYSDDFDHRVYEYEDDYDYEMFIKDNRIGSVIINEQQFK